MKHSAESATQAFSLLELLVVLGILLVLVVVTAPAISQMLGSSRLARAGALVRDQLQAARQTAITRNTPITVSFCQVPDDTGKPTYNTLWITDGTSKPVVRAVRLPPGISLSEQTNWSSVMNLPQASVSLPGNPSATARQIRFLPTGATDAPKSESWYVTLFEDRRSSAPDRNFITLALDPLTGRLMSYQP